jgi:hypothetical protein
LRVTPFRRRAPPAAFTLRRPHPALIGTAGNAGSFPLSAASRTVPKFRRNPAFPRAGTGAGAGPSQNSQIPACGSGNPAFFPRDIFTLHSSAAIPDKPLHPAISYWLTPAHASSLTAATPHPEATLGVPLFTHRNCTAAPACYQLPCANAHTPRHGLASGTAPGEAGSNSSAHAPT